MNIMKKYCFLIIGLLFLTPLLFSQRIDRVRVIRDFFENPFIENIMFPNIFHFYKGFDDLYERLGEPLERVKLTVPESYNMGTHTYEYVYENFNIGLVYAESKNEIYIFYVWIPLNENIICKYDLKMDDPLEKIIGIFGYADRINEFENGIIEHNYILSLNIFDRDSYDGTLKFQFKDNKLKSIIIWKWN